ncbi:MAG: hypothetical protein ABIG56_06145 [Candidatus Omnitrophota bacterium]
MGCAHCIMACPLGVLKLVDKKSKVVNYEAYDSQSVVLQLARRKQCLI